MCVCVLTLVSVVCLLWSSLCLVSCLCFKARVDFPWEGVGRVCVYVCVCGSVCGCSHLLPRVPGQNERGEDRQGVFGVSGPALDGRPHGQAEQRHGLRQGEGLIVLLWEPREQTCTHTHTHTHTHLNYLFESTNHILYRKDSNISQRLNTA